MKHVPPVSITLKKYVHVKAALEMQYLIILACFFGFVLKKSDINLSGMAFIELFFLCLYIAQSSLL